MENKMQDKLDERIKKFSMCGLKDIVKEIVSAQIMGDTDSAMNVLIDLFASSYEVGYRDCRSEWKDEILKNAQESHNATFDFVMTLIQNPGILNLEKRGEKHVKC